MEDITDNDDLPKKKQKKSKDLDFSFDKEITPTAPIQGKSFKKIEEILQMESANIGSFDDSEQDEERKKMEDRRKQCEEFKKQLLEWKNRPLDDFTSEVAKSLIEKGMNMIDALEKEILDSPRGRDVETAAAMMSSISGIIDMLNKKKLSNVKMDFEREKFEWQKQSTNIGPSLTQNNLIFAGTNTDLLDIIQGKKPFPVVEKEVEVIKTENNRND